MSDIKKALTTCIEIVEEDLRRYKQAQKEDSRALGGSEARAVKDYLTSLSAAYRAAGSIEATSDDYSLEEIEQELKERYKEEND